MVPSVGVGLGPTITCDGTAATVGVFGTALPGDGGGAPTDVPGCEGMTRLAVRPVVVGVWAPPVVFRESVDSGDGGGGASPPRTKFHEHVPAEDVAGGAPGKFGGVAAGRESLILVCVGAPSIMGNGHSSTYGIAVPVVVPTLRSCAAFPKRTLPFASRIVIVSGIGWPSVVHCSVTAD